MKTFVTNSDLIEKMLQENASLLDSPSDKISANVEHLELSQIIAPDWLMVRYLNDPREQAKLENWGQLIESGTVLPPLVVDKFNNLIDGIHRFMACQSKNLTHAPCLRYNNELILSPLN